MQISALFVEDRHCGCQVHCRQRHNQRPLVDIAVVPCPRRAAAAVDIDTKGVSVRSDRSGCSAGINTVVAVVALSHTEGSSRRELFDDDRLLALQLDAVAALDGAALAAGIGIAPFRINHDQERELFVLISAAAGSDRFYRQLAGAFFDNNEI